jgi:hypothetical protein
MRFRGVEASIESIKGVRSRGILQMVINDDPCDTWRLSSRD